MNAKGIVDRDGRSDEERDVLAGKGIFVLPVSEVENLYYLPEVIQVVAKKQAEVNGENADELVRAAREAGLKALADGQTLQRLARKLAKDEVARALLAAMPDEVSECDINVTVSTPYPRILRELEDANNNADYEAFIHKVPVRDTSFRVQVARALQFQSFMRYEKAALVAIKEDACLASNLSQEIFGNTAVSD